MPLDIPESERTNGRGNGLRQTKICVLQETKLEFVILTDGNESSCGVQSLYAPWSHSIAKKRKRAGTYIGEEEKREKVYERVRKFLVLFHS